MPTKIQRLLPLLQENAWPATVAVLAESLGVSAESLYRLGVGYAPVVEFKRGRNYNGWWAFPERDFEGEVVGVSLRGQDKAVGKKPMVPGSKHGMFFEVADGYEEGTGEEYRSGKHNWVRTMDAGELCPVCGKPDGCLLSSEDPTDPKAVICLREVSPQPKQLGWLHIRKESGKLKPGGKALSASPFPIVIVEGATDTAAALDLGFSAVGRPSNLAGLPELARLVQDRDLIIVGENDEKWNAALQRMDFPGQQGLNAAFEYLRPHGRKVVKLMPPEEYKDLRTWYRSGLTQEAFLAYVEEHGETQAEMSHLDNVAPVHIATRWLARDHTLGEHLVLRKYRQAWYRFDGSKYDEVESDMAIRGGLYAYLDGKTCSKMVGGEETVAEYVPTKSKVNDIVDALNKDCPVGAAPPCWLNEDGGPDPKSLIVYTNGILDAEAYLDGDPEALLDPTPNLFTMTALPYAFDPLATCPSWMEFLEQVLGDDPAKIDLLQEWFGYNMLLDNSHEKMMFFQGPRRAGKGTTFEMMLALLGREQVASTNFDSIANPNGTAQLVNKLAAIMPDAVLSHRVDKPKALGSLLSIVGNDPVPIRRLYCDEYTAKLPVRFTVAVNELPALPDHSRALESRMLVLQFANSFVNREDRTLKDRLPAEAPGVALWALEGLRRLRENKRFTEPESSVEVLNDFRKVASPIAEFLDDCCDITEDIAHEVERSKLYDVWAGWCRERGISPGMVSRFVSRATAAAPGVHADSYVRLGETRKVFTGIKVQAWAERRLLGRPA